MISLTIFWILHLEIVWRHSSLPLYMWAKYMKSEKFIKLSLLL